MKAHQHPGRKKAREEWGKRNPERLAAIVKKAMAKYYKNNRQAHLEKMRKEKVQLKIEALHHYSKGSIECKKCGHNNVISLDIDHIQEGQKGIMRSHQLYRWLRRNNYPKGFQVLCRNCNYQKHYKYIQSKYVR